MKRERIVDSLIIIVALLIFVVPVVIGLSRESSTISGTLAFATWNVSLNQTGVNSSLVVVPETSNATYTLNVISQSETDIKYSVIISNLPPGIEVSFDNGEFQQQSNNTISFADVGTILYSSDSNNMKKSHTLTFRATSGAAVVNNQNVNIDVIVRQIV